MSTGSASAQLRWRLAHMLTQSAVFVPSYKRRLSMLRAPVIVEQQNIRNNQPAGDFDECAGGCVYVGTTLHRPTCRMVLLPCSGCLIVCFHPHIRCRKIFAATCTAR